MGIQMIQLQSITKKFGNTTILDHTSYTFPKKGLVCLMGASGSGKTTLFNLLAGFDSQFEGKIYSNKSPLHELDATLLCNYRRESIGFVFQNYHLLNGYTVLENILMPCNLLKCDMSQKRKEALSLLEKLGISQKENEKAENLSGGQKQRVALARAFIQKPNIILADEPTGALDRNTSTEIMTLLKEYSKDHLVVVITHDKKVCEFADECIYLENNKIKSIHLEDSDLWTETRLTLVSPKNVPILQCAAKNFLVHLKRYILISLAISIGLIAFLCSLSFGNIMETSIHDFKQKNTAFQNGYIKGTNDDTLLNYLEELPYIESAYYQYKLTDITLTLNETSETMQEKIPMPKTTESLSYGVMPRIHKNEIAITPSLAKKFSMDLTSLLGKQITLKMGQQNYELTISGIYNAGYDDFFVSADVEQAMYQQINPKDHYSISYDVKEFQDVTLVDELLKEKGITSENASKEVYALLHTFEKLQKTFFAISILILGVALLICIVLLVKLQNSRYREVGLLSALGYYKTYIIGILLLENAFLAALASCVSLVFLLLITIIGNISSFPFSLSIWQISIAVFATFVVMALISSIASYKLIQAEPAVALKK